MISPYVYPGKSDVIINTPDKVIEDVCQYYKISRGQIVSRSRKENIIVPRHMAIYIIRRNFPEVKLKSIGKMFGNRDHSTIISAVKSIDSLISVDWNNIKQDIKNLMK